MFFEETSSELCPQFIHLDFEISQYKAAQQCFPGAKIVACKLQADVYYIHLYRAWFWKNETHFRTFL